MLPKSKASLLRSHAHTFTSGWGPLSTAMRKDGKDGRSLGVRPTSLSVIAIGGENRSDLEVLLMECNVELTVVDKSAAVIDDLKQRFGSLSKYVAWKVGDVVDVELPDHAYDVWFDGNHYGTMQCEARRARYVDKMHRCVRAGGTTLVTGHVSPPPGPV
jgi:hypothetical protein